MKSHLYVAACEQNSRISFVFDTICEWYDWEWSYSQGELEDSALKFSYGVEGQALVSISPKDCFGIDRIGRKGSKSTWGMYQGVPNPCGSDPIAGIFYLLSCAEEYTNSQFDTHGRVAANTLSVVKLGYAAVPIADRLAQVLAEAIWTASGSSGKPKMRAATGYSSLDIDQVFAIQHKPWYKKISNLGRAMLKGDIQASSAVVNTLLGGKDPFDQFDWIEQIHAERQLKPLVFLLMGYENATDPAWNPGHPQWPSLLTQLSPWTTLGVHPSYLTSTDDQLLKEEKGRLERLLGKEVTRSRQHFLRISWPSTFQSLIDVGIQHDYTLAWPDLLGFRMGTARSCFWYDLEKDEKTSLLLHPPSMMEVTGRFYQGLSPKHFLEKAHHLAKESKKSASGLRVIWHNSNLSHLGGWRGWKAIYPNMLDLIKE